MSEKDTSELDRRKLLKRLAGAGAAGWVAPVILSSSPAAAGVFTAKCAPGTITGTNSFVRTACLSNGSNITITLVFSGPCPCGGVQVWCAQKNTPTPTASSATQTLVFSQFVPIGSVVISGKVGLGCTDRDGDRQFAVYDWSMTASDNGQACNTVINSITPLTFSNRTLVTSATCPSLASFAAVATQSAPTGATRQEG